MKKNLGVSSMDALSMFLSQWLYGEKDLEEAFEGIGEEVETLVWVGKFEGKKNSALFVVPYIHFGPFGNLGGSEFTWQIADSLCCDYAGERKHTLRHQRDVFVFHGMATHDFNPVSSGEIHNVVGACRRAIAKLRPKMAKLSFSTCRMGTVRAAALHIDADPGVPVHVDLRQFFREGLHRGGARDAQGAAGGLGRGLAAPGPQENQEGRNQG